ncbi:MAG: pilus assembly protein PilB, partial [Opitutales bacterium]|nr:pilus assembly protein PilB [Opitutales bacterium]
MFEDNNSTIYEILKEKKILSVAQLDDLKETHLSTGKSFADVVIDSGLVSKDDLLKAIAEYLSYECMLVPPPSIEEAVHKQLRAQLARNYGVVPVRASDTSIDLLAKDPFNNAIIDDLTFTLNKDVHIIVTDPSYVDTLIKSCYGDEDTSIDDLLSEISGSATYAEGDVSENDIANMANETPIIRFVNLVLQQAIRDKASDIHFEPFENQFRIRYRIDGALYEMAPP